MQDLNRVHVEGIDWAELVPVTRMFGAFRMAIHPSKLALGLLLTVLLYLGGLGLDVAFGPRVHDREVARYQTTTPEAYETFITEWNKAAAQRQLAPGNPDPRHGVFETLLQEELAAFDRMIGHAIQLELGLTAFLTGQPREGVLGAILYMIIVIPGWLYHTHPGFLAAYMAFAFLLTCILGGAISRHAALQATIKRPPTIVAAVAFAATRYVHLVLTPLAPVIVIAGIGLLMAVAGLVFFNVPVLDLFGGLGFGLLLLGGLVIALIVIGWFGASGLMFPAVAVEDADFFDAISRSFGYVIGRPWRWLFYNLFMVIYGALTYLFVGLVVFLTLWATKVAADLFVFREVAQGVSRLDAMMPDPRLGQLMTQPTDAMEELNWSGKAAGWLITVWVRLLVLLMPAFAVSFFFSAQTWVYLLLRRSADGIGFDEVYTEPVPEAAAQSTPDKVEAAPTDGGGTAA